MNAEIKEKKYQKHPDRITLSSGALERVNAWLDQIRDELKGIRISRNDLVEHFILAQPDQLPSEVIEALKDARFDEVAFAAWALRELKAARSRGDKLTLADIVTGAHAAKERKVRRRKSLSPDRMMDETPSTPSTGTPFTVDKSSL